MLDESLPDTTEAYALPLETHIDKTLEFVQSLLHAMKMEVQIQHVAPLDSLLEQNTSSSDEEEKAPELYFEIQGPDAKYLIGKQGVVLDALQHLTARALWQATDTRPPHITIDAEGYRVRRDAQLTKMAQQLAERVIHEGKVITFDPMSARDRMIVHKAVQGIEGLYTESVGEEPSRQVQLLPHAKS